MFVVGKKKIFEFQMDLNRHHKVVTNFFFLSDNTNSQMISQKILSTYLSLKEVSLILYSDMKMNSHIYIVKLKRIK